MKIDAEAAARIAELSERYTQTHQAQRAAGNQQLEYIMRYMKEQQTWESPADLEEMYRRLPKGAPADELFMRSITLRETSPQTADMTAAPKAIVPETETVIRRLSDEHQQREKLRQEAHAELSALVRAYMTEKQMWDVQEDLLEMIRLLPPGSYIQYILFSRYHELESDARQTADHGPPTQGPTV